MTRAVDRLFGKRPPVPGVDFPVPFNEECGVSGTDTRIRCGSRNE